MDQFNHEPQPEQLSPEEQLDLLLEKFLEDPNDEIPTLAEIAAEEPSEEILTELPPEPESVEFETPESQLDALLTSFLSESDESSDDTSAEVPAEMPELLSFWDVMPSASDINPEDSAEEETPAVESNEEDAIEEDSSTAVIPVADIATEGYCAEEASVEDGPVAEAPAEEVPTEEAPAEESPTEDVSVAEVPMAELPVDTQTEVHAETPTINELDDTSNDSSSPDQSSDNDSMVDPADLEFARILEETHHEDWSNEESNTEKGQTETEDHQQKATDNAENMTPAAIPEEKEEMSESDEELLPEEIDEIDEDPALPKKRRPKNTKAYGLFGIPHLLTTFIWLGIIVFIGVGLGKFVWNCAADVLALGRPDVEVVITISEEDDLEAIAQKLKTTGLIQYPSLFKIYGQISEAMDSIRTGTFKLNTKFDYHALVDAMSSNQRRETTNVTIPEGYTCAQMFQLLENRGITTVAKLEEAAANGDLGDYWFLEDVERGNANCLEGFLFPDTYTFYLDHDPVGVLKKFLDNFNKRFNDAMKIKLDTLNLTLSEMMRANGLSEEYIADHQMTVRDVVIIASMIEKETASNPESYNISSVIYNRLTNPNEFPCLQIDATIVYYTGRSKITAEDLATDHPYNSYTRPGLVAGPISNPGSYSLDAALDPTESNFYFYALDPSTGEHHFSKTLKEHNAFLESIRKEEPEEEAPQE